MNGSTQFFHYDTQTPATMNPKTMSALIFDLDGTLLDTLDDIAFSANKTLQTYGWREHDVDAYKHFVGNGLHVLMQRIVPPETSDEEILKGVETFSAIYERTWNLSTQPYPDIVEMLKLFKHRGMKMAILSNKPDSFTQKCVSHHFSTIGFDCISGKKDLRPAKPDPTVTLEILEAFGVEPEQALFVGDSSVDIQTGLNAGMNTVGVDWGFRTREELVGAGAHIVVSTPKELIEYVIEC